ncbi:MAG: hypothetical protein NT038_09530 [Euryarchaeota archaeon]|nr:hypothetical protein [Euryarchaeota archaeon]
MKQVHLKDKIKEELINIIINFGDADEKHLNIELADLENRLRHDAYYYISRGDYNSNDVIDILNEIAAEQFLEKGLDGVEFKNKELMKRKLHTILANLKRYMTMLKNWA